MYLGKGRLGKTREKSMAGICHVGPAGRALAISSSSSRERSYNLKKEIKLTLPPSVTLFITILFSEHSIVTAFPINHFSYNMSCFVWTRSWETFCQLCWRNRLAPPPEIVFEVLFQELPMGLSGHPGQVGLDVIYHGQDLYRFKKKNIGYQVCRGLWGLCMLPHCPGSFPAQGPDLGGFILTSHLAHSCLFFRSQHKHRVLRTALSDPHPNLNEQFSCRVCVGGGGRHFPGFFFPL